MGRSSVRTYERKVPRGGTVQVRQHKRRRGPDPGRAWQSVRRGWKHQRKGNPSRALAWTAAAVLEIVAYVLFKGVGFGLLTFALLAGGAATMLLRASSGKADS